MITTFTPTNMGEAAITVKRNKVKIYPPNHVFLQDKQEFEIELFNPSNVTKLAKISINGKPISSAGLVLKPGQRVSLERYIDTPKKFLFETYQVDGADSAVQKAIQQNGLITVDFRDEKSPDPAWSYSFGTASTDSLNNLFNAQADLGKYKTKSLNSQASLRSSKGFMETVSFMSAAPKETGRVESGSYSSQEFGRYQGDFNTWVTNTVTIKLLPQSEKPVEIKDLAVYCTECGTKNKGGNYKFCPSCGNKFGN